MVVGHEFPGMKREMRWAHTIDSCRRQTKTRMRFSFPLLLLPRHNNNKSSVLKRFMSSSKVPPPSTTSAASSPIAPKKMFANQPTFSQQTRIPRLPIPTLAETGAKYLLSLQPLLSPEHHQKVKDIVSDFIKPGGLGSTLQQRLIDYDKTQKASILIIIYFNIHVITIHIMINYQFH